MYGARGLDHEETEMTAHKTIETIAARGIIISECLCGHVVSVNKGYDDRKKLAAKMAAHKAESK